MSIATLVFNNPTLLCTLVRDYLEKQLQIENIEIIDVALKVSANGAKLPCPTAQAASTLHITVSGDGVDIKNHLKDFTDIEVVVG